MADITLILPEHDDIASDFRDAWQARGAMATPAKTVDVSEGTLPHKISLAVADITLPFYANDNAIANSFVVRGMMAHPDAGRLSSLAQAVAEGRLGDPHRPILPARRSGSGPGARREGRDRRGRAHELSSVTRSLCCPTRGWRSARPAGLGLTRSRGAPST